VDYGNGDVVNVAHGMISKDIEWTEMQLEASAKHAQSIANLAASSWRKHMQSLKEEGEANSKM
jgi:hypothetical protein